MDQIEGAKGQLAEGAERVAAAVERTADELEGDGDNAISGFGHSVASLMRQLAGGLRERDVEAFARELAALARRNPGVFLAGSVALGFGIARAFKAQAPQSSTIRADGRQSDGGWQSSRERVRSGRELDDAEERLDLSASSSDKSQSGTSQASSASPDVSRDDNERNVAKLRQQGKNKTKPRASSAGAQQQSRSPEPSAMHSAPAATTARSEDGTSMGGSGGGASRGGKS